MYFMAEKNDLGQILPAWQLTRGSRAFSVVWNRILPFPLFREHRALVPAVKPGSNPVRSPAVAGIVKPKPLCYNNLYGASANP